MVTYTISHAGRVVRTDQVAGPGQSFTTTKGTLFPNSLNQLHRSCIGFVAWMNTTIININYSIPLRATP